MSIHGASAIGQRLDRDGPESAEHARREREDDADRPTERRGADAEVPRQPHRSEEGGAQQQRSTRPLDDPGLATRWCGRTRRRDRSGTGSRTPGSAAGRRRPSGPTGAGTARGSPGVLRSGRAWCRRRCRPGDCDEGDRHEDQARAQRAGIRQASRVTRPRRPHDDEVPADAPRADPAPGHQRRPTRAGSAAQTRRRSAAPCAAARRAHRAPRAAVTRNMLTAEVVLGPVSVRALVAVGRAGAAEVVPGRGLVPAPRAEPRACTTGRPARRAASPAPSRRPCATGSGTCSSDVARVGDVERGRARPAGPCRRRAPCAGPGSRPCRPARRRPRRAARSVAPTRRRRRRRSSPGPRRRRARTRRPAGVRRAPARRSRAPARRRSRSGSVCSTRKAREQVDRATQGRPERRLGVRVTARTVPRASGSDARATARGYRLVTLRAHRRCRCSLGRTGR